MHASKLHIMLPIQSDHVSQVHGSLRRDTALIATHHDGSDHENGAISMKIPPFLYDRDHYRKRYFLYKKS
jgi:hypothetical protein